MMEAKDLRIGNYVKYEGYECYREINEISKHCIKYHDSMLMPYCEAPDKPVIVGIPLTEEWLLKFGFIKECDWKISIGEGAFIWIDENDFTVAIGIPYEASGNQRTMKHVHQLQNLYHALTGEELTIK